MSKSSVFDEINKRNRTRKLKEIHDEVLEFGIMSDHIINHLDRAIDELTSEDLNAVLDDGETLLTLAAKHCSPELCKTLLRLGAKVDQANNDGKTPLAMIFECEKKIFINRSVCEVLLEAGANPNHEDKFGNTPFYMAIKTFFESSIKKEIYSVWKNMILKYGADYQQQNIQPFLNKMLDESTGKKDFYMAKKLIDAGAGMTYLEDDEAEEVSLYVAAVDGNYKLCEELIKTRVDPNLRDSGGLSALYFICKSGQDSLAAMLLDIGADPNIRDHEGLTPLYFACSYGSIDMVEKLISKGADVDSAGCLQIALDLYYIDVAKKLISCKCDVNKVKIKN